MIRATPGPAEGEYTLVLDHLATLILVFLLDGEIAKLERRGKRASGTDLERKHHFNEIQAVIRRAWRDAALLSDADDMPVQ